MNDVYQTVCVTIVTAAGSCVVIAFTCYFVMVVVRLIQDAQRPSQRGLTLPSENLLRCGCGAALGPVEKVEAKDDGVFEIRACTVCVRRTMSPRKEPV